jgi:hypothetical protein
MGQRHKRLPPDKHFSMPEAKLSAIDACCVKATKDHLLTGLKRNSQPTAYHQRLGRPQRHIHEHCDEKTKKISKLRQWSCLAVNS